jgi:hypothetical protein
MLDALVDLGSRKWSVQRNFFLEAGQIAGIALL